MRITTLILLLFFFNTGNAAALKESSTFKHHTFEFSITPAVDYHFITYPDRSPYLKIETNYLFRPFIGGNIGLAYTYRPMKYIGFSAGINYLEYVNKLSKLKNLAEISPTRFWIYNGYAQSGYIGLPILIHAYYQVKKFDLDFATGPQFSFPIYTIAKYAIVSSTQQPFYMATNQTQLYGAAAMGQQSYFGWETQLTISVFVKNFFCISVGPEVTFISAKPLDTKVYYTQLADQIAGFKYSAAYPTSAHEIDYYTGIKLCFRLATDFPGKKSKDAKTSVSN